MYGPKQAIQRIKQRQPIMTNKIKDFLSVWKEDYLFKTVFASAVTALVNIAFTVYNGVLGILYHSSWNRSICVYYLVLSIIRAVVVYSQKGALKTRETKPAEHQRKVYLVTHLLLLFMNLCLIAPIASMIRGERSYIMGMIPAIAMAAYTTYRIIVSIMHYKRSRRQENMLLAELRTINLIDALVAVLTLQNALIMANGGQSKHMVTVTAWTSGGILLLIVIVTIRSFCKLKS